MTGYGNIQLVTIFAMKYGKNNHQLRDSTVKSFLIISQVFTYYKHTVYATWSMGHIQTITHLIRKWLNQSRETLMVIDDISG